jgi:hypothetical protein
MGQLAMFAHIVLERREAGPCERDNP